MKIRLFAKVKQNSIKVLTSMALINSNISHDDEFVLISNTLNEYDYMNKEMKNLKT